MSDWHYDLALRQELDIAEEQIAGWVLEEFKLLNKTVPVGQGPEQKQADLSHHQFTQALTEAQESASVPVLINYLRYQIANAPKDQGWRWQEIGEEIINFLQKTVRAMAKSKANTAAERVRGKGATATQEEQHAAWIQLSSRFLGLLRWQFIQRRDEYETGEEGQND